MLLFHLWRNSSEYPAYYDKVLLKLNLIQELGNLVKMLAL